MGKKGSERSPLWGMAASITFVAGVLALLVYFDIHKQIASLLLWFESQGAWAAVWFILLMATAVVLLLPGVLLTTGAGFVFGVAKGTLYVVVGTTLGAILAFLVARYLFGARARRFITARARLHMLSEELTHDGWKIVLLTRLIPFFPSKVSNYFFGLTSVPLRGYTVGSLLGFIPFSLHSVYLGSIAADVTTLGVRNVGRSPLEWTLYAGGFIATAIAVVWVTRLARRALYRYEDAGVIAEDLP
ncbi:TVP38/TMEM64 family protein [Haliea sp. E1-2-M8]|uniref:TVP38/TMEM64 family protein n=1 Tax=Haliea sp. E1-2-M8 TaxID=3064706 RepID=UPI002718B44B|nr:TVP38/TMEM64 family protein [Haliea sp. E1-2-M8]MDO8860582.1 TVP38/TMEM64 family protein [Haliea sp. E1-2-M8]